MLIYMRMRITCNCKYLIIIILIKLNLIQLQVGIPSLYIRMHEYIYMTCSGNVSGKSEKGKSEKENQKTYCYNSDPTLAALAIRKMPMRGSSVDFDSTMHC